MELFTTSAGDSKTGLGVQSPIRRSSNVVDTEEEKKALALERRWYHTDREEIIRYHGDLQEPTYYRTGDALKAYKQDMKNLKKRIAKLESQDPEGTPQTSKVLHGCDWAYGYTVSVRIRFTIIFLLALCLTFCLMVSFVLTLLFAVILHDSTSDQSWTFRLIFMLPCAPFVLIVGSLICDDLWDLLIDALGYFPMHQYRLKLAAIVYYLYRRLVKRASVQDLMEEGSPKLRLSHMRIVEFVMPGILEFAGILGLIIAFFSRTTMFTVFATYLTICVLAACAYGISSVVVTIVTAYHVCIRKIFLKLTADSPAIHQRILHENPPKSTKGVRVLNLLRYLVPKGVFTLKEEERCCFMCCKMYDMCFKRYHDTCSWGVRLSLNIAGYVAFAALSVVTSFPTGARWFFVVLFICLIGFKFRERWPFLFGSFYNMLMFFFIFASFFYFLLAVAQPTLDKHIFVLQPKLANASAIIPGPVDESVAGYPVCRRTWKGLTALDLLLLSEITYTATTQKMRENLVNAFNGTSISNATLIRRDDERTINFIHVHFPSLNTDVVAVRGTSNEEEAFTDTYLYSTVSIFQSLNVWIPFLQVFPDAFIRDIVEFVALKTIAGSQPYRWVDEYVRDLNSQGKNVVMTGHSLGGTIAGIVGVDNRVPGLYLSPPGMFYSNKRFGISLNDVMQFNTVIVPQQDAITNVDNQWGDIQNIRCTGSVTECHEVNRNICTIFEICGDVRQREWSEKCKDIKDNETSVVRVVGWSLLSLTVVVLLVTMWRLRWRICPCCFSMPKEDDRPDPQETESQNICGFM
ncbi:hypothetical protein AAMO2058_000426200 [Amorphochlora amoebiformis]